MDDYRSKRSRIVLEGVGTRGDVAPLIAVGSRLAARGYACTLLANQQFAVEARSAGLDFAAITAQSANFCGAERHRVENYFFPGLAATLEHFRSRAAPAAIVNLDRSCASNLAAEQRGVPVIRLHLAPFKLRSLVAPPWPFAAHARGPLGRAYLDRWLPRFYAACDGDPRIVGHLNRSRALFALPPVTSAAHDEGYVAGHVALFPDWFCPRAPDWPEPLHFAGFPLPRVPRAMPPELAEFVRRQGAPIVFTAGTGLSDVGTFFEQARGCCEALALPGVFLSPHLNASARTAAGRLFVADFVELGALLPWARLLVHHGGIGTTARALEAGVPQLVSPMGFDQPDNAQRVASLGVARVVERARASAASLAAAARELLADEHVPRALAALRARVQAEDGVERCADGVEQALDRAGVARPERGVATDAKEAHVAS